MDDATTGFAIVASGWLEEELVEIQTAIGDRDYDMVLDGMFDALGVILAYLQIEAQSKDSVHAAHSEYTASQVRRERDTDMFHHHAINSVLDALRNLKPSDEREFATKARRMFIDKFNNI
jgi:hypothetical protein